MIILKNDKELDRVLIPHFKFKEFICKCGECHFSFVNEEALEVLEEVRELYDNPITFSSAYRCQQHNRNVGGAAYSDHQIGCGFDVLHRNDMNLINLLEDYFDYTDLHDSFIHCSYRR